MLSLIIFDNILSKVASNKQVSVSPKFGSYVGGAHKFQFLPMVEPVRLFTKSAGRVPSADKFFEGRCKNVNISFIY